MIDWLLAPIDAARGHDLAMPAAWHGRLMVLAWAVLLPLGVIIARFFKVTPRQNWPGELDDKLWWRAHLILQYGAMLVVVVALAQVWRGGAIPRHWHEWLGWGVVGACALQVVGGWLRGSKGGPTNRRADGALDGDHYCMTRRRRTFERVHKSLGYATLVVSIAVILSGLWLVNAPRWMWLALGLWWLLVIGAWSRLQAQGKAIDTYQAIWGPDLEHPGNRVAPTGWGVRRPPPGAASSKQATPDA